jgi:hypothetical protein
MVKCNRDEKKESYKKENTLNKIVSPIVLTTIQKV